ncbi:hypothetical protein PENTCL1PPCAC_1735, partial [Pristionchus entomophagus]
SRSCSGCLAVVRRIGGRVSGATEKLIRVSIEGLHVGETASLLREGTHSDSTRTNVSCVSAARAPVDEGIARSRACGVVAGSARGGACTRNCPFTPDSTRRTTRGHGNCCSGGRSDSRSCCGGRSDSCSCSCSSCRCDRCSGCGRCCRGRLAVVRGIGGRVSGTTEEGIRVTIEGLHVGETAGLLREGTHSDSTRTNVSCVSAARAPVDEGIA